MNYQGLSYCIFPLGDSALTIDFGNVISDEINEMVVARFHQLKQHPLPGLIEVVPAYSSLTIFYDVFDLKKNISQDLTTFDWMKKLTEDFLNTPFIKNDNEKRLIYIPVCYQDEFSPDLLPMSEAKNITPDELIQIHTSGQYKVYMLGFLPGFAYLGKVDERISMPRKPQPENVAEGSVGIAGKQTGIYPLASPGGWQIIGRTPLRLSNPEDDNPTLLTAGDTVQFYSISKDEFESY